MKKEKKKKESVNVLIDEEKKRMLEEIAKDNYRSVSDEVRFLIDKSLLEHGKIVKTNF